MQMQTNLNSIQKSTRKKNILVSLNTMNKGIRGGETEKCHQKFAAGGPTAIYLL